MNIPPIPVQSLLVPPIRPVLPEGFTERVESILNGLPHVIEIDSNAKLVLVVPSGLANFWRDADPTTLVSSSEDEAQPVSAGTSETRPRYPGRILLRVGGRTTSSVPLSLGLRRAVPDSGNTVSGVRYEILILSWEIRAGSLRGPGDFGSRITLAVRAADQASDAFNMPPVNTNLLRRLENEFRIQSDLSGDVSKQSARFQLKKVIGR